MASSLETRVRQLEQELALLRREIAGVVGRPAAPNAPRQGWFLGVLTSALTQGGSASVRIIGRSGTNWTYPDADEITALDFFMNEDEDDYPIGTKVKVEWYRNAWVITLAWCDPSDTLPDEPPAEGEGQPPETEGGENSLPLAEGLLLLSDPSTSLESGLVPQEFP